MSDESPKIFSKEWLWFVLACFGILGFIAILVLIFGDKAGDFIYLFASWFFFFIIGTVFGLHRAKMQDIKSKRKEKHISK